jgi:hypothetical protein
MELVFLLLFTLFCIEHYALYKCISNNPKLSTKQKSWILSIKTSFILMCIGIYYNFRLFTSALDFETYISGLTNNDMFIQKMSLILFTSYLFMDMFIGNTQYPSFIKTLSGNVHHSFYIFINILILFTKDLYPLFVLFFIEELPTCILGIGSYNKKYRKNRTFGLAFFITRIIYHLVFVYQLRHQNIILLVGSLAFFVHSYWFTLWLKKYS